MSSLALVNQKQTIGIFPDLGILFPNYQHNRQKVYYTKDGMSIKSRLIEFIDHIGINAKTFEVTAGLGNGFVNNAGDSIRRVSLEKISKAYPQLNTAWILTGEGDMIRNPKSIFSNDIQDSKIDNEAILIGRVPGPDEFTEMTELGNNDYGMVIPKIPFKAWAGYVDNFGDIEYMDSLPKYNVTITGATRGRYFAYIVDGDSMENYSTEELARKSIPKGTIVTAREIPRHNWRTKLHLHRFQNYVIVQQTGMVVKQIIEHNIQEGYIICHSLNADYEDFKLMLDDCMQILNIVRRELPE